MKTFFKRLVVTVLFIIAFVVVTPFAVIYFGPDGISASAKMLLNGVVGYGIASPSKDVVQHRLVVPEGYQLNLYAEGLGRVRFMAMSEHGDILMSRPNKGEVVLLKRDANQDGRADAEIVLLRDLVTPHGVALADGWLYIAESNAVGKVAFDSQTGSLAGDYHHIAEGFSASGNHWTKSLGLGPDGWLYLTSGSSCNVCEEDDPQRATMMRMKTDGSELEIVATGLRNSVGFDWAPWDGSLYATDNGRDLLGDNFPPCELNKIELGAFYGWPYINGDGHLDPDYGQGKEHLLATATSPVHAFPAHNAPLGITFLRHNTMDHYQRSALVALHGSWNRSELDGYKVVSLHWLADGSIVEKDFITGFLQGSDVIGRPVGMVEASNGDIFVSDDYSGSVFKVRVIDVAAGAQTMSVQAETATGPAAIEPAEKVDPDVALSIYSGEQLREMQAEGRKLYQQYRCGNCHDAARATLMRKTIPLVDIAEHYSLEELADFFVAPTPPMPVFPLNADQRKALSVLLYKQ